MSTTEFLKKIKSGAILGWERHRILPSITGAQAILEGASGTSKLAQAPYYNQFGIKASDDWTGKKVPMMTWEEINGKKVYVEADFRWYDSIEESIADHAAFFTSTEWRKNNYKEVVGEKDYRKAARALQNAPQAYATDSDYANKLITRIESYGLRAWDEEAFSGDVAGGLEPVSSEGAMITPTTETDVVGRYNIEDLEYKDDLLHSPKGESVIYNPTLNDAYGFQTKSGDVLWIDHVLEVNSEDPQEIMDEAVKYMKENAQPDAQYRVKLKHLPDNISIGDTGMFVDHKFNPPLYIEARILEIVTSISNPENDSVVVGNVREVKSQTDASIRALQKELQDTREKLVDDYFAQKALEVSIQSNNGLALIDTGVTHAIELIAEPQNEIKLVANTPYKINLNAPVGANVDTYTLTGELLNNTFTAEFEDVVNPIVVEPEPVIDETLISGIVGSDNHGSTVESPQGDKVAIVDSVADFTGLRVKELNFKFYDATGALVHEEDVPVNINSKISHSVFKEGVIFASMVITSKADVTVQGLSFKEPSIFGDGAKTTDLIAHFNFDIPHNYIWTRVSDDDDADLLWNDRNKFNNSNILKITIEDINGNKSTFILTVYDENGNVIAGTSETVTVDKSPDKISAEVEEAILEGERLKQIAEQAYTDAVADAKAHADAGVQASKEYFDNLIEEVELDVADAQATADSAVNQIDTAVANAGFTSLDDTIQNISGIASGVKSELDIAIQNAGFTSLDDTIQNMKDITTNADQNAQEAFANASSAYGLAQTSISEAQTAQANSLTALSNADDALDGVSDLDFRVDEVEGELELKADNTFMTEDGTLTTLSNAITFNANRFSSDMSRIESRVESLAGEINLIVLRDAFKGTRLMGGEVYPNTTPYSQSNTMREMIDVTPGEKLAISKETPSSGYNYFTINYYDENYVYKSLLHTQSNQQVITIPFGIYKMWVAYPAGSKPQIVRGTQFLPYRPSVADQMTTDEMVLFRNEYDEYAEGTERRLSAIDSAGGSLDVLNNRITTEAGLVRTDMTALIDTKVSDDDFSEFYQNEYLETAGEVSRKISLSDVKVGVRNLLKDTSPDEITSLNEREYFLASPLSVGYYIVSFEAKASAPTTASVYINDNTGQNRVRQRNFTSVSLTTGFKRFEVEIEIYEADSVSIDNISLRVRSADISITDKLMKLEKGNVATGWERAPEDEDAKIAHIETEWTQTFDTFSQTVSGIDGRVTAQKQTIDSISSTVSGHGGRLSAVEQTASGLQTTVAEKANQSQVTQLATGLSSVVSNFKNLLPDSLLFSKPVPQGVPIGSSENSVLYRNIAVKPNTTYTLSYNKNTTSPNLTVMTYTDYDSNVSSHNRAYASDKRSREITVQSGDSFTTTNSEQYVFITTGNATINLHYVEYRVLQLEEGSVATVWTRPYGGLSQISQLTDSITATVSSLDGRVTTQKQTLESISSTVSGHNGRLSTVEQTATGLQSAVYNADGSSKITQLANGVQSVVTNINKLEDNFKNLLPDSEKRVGGIGTGALIGGTTGSLVYQNIPVKPNTTYSLRYAPYVNSPTLVVLTYSDFANNIQTHNQAFAHGNRIREFRLTSTQSFTTAPNERYIAISTGNSRENNTGNYVDYRNLQLEEGVSTDWTGAHALNSYASQISQLANNINLRVSKGDVVNQINVSPEGILIDGEKIHITGKTTIDNAVITDAHIKELDAEKITSGTIDTARLDATEIITEGLEADVITSDFIKSDFALIDVIFSDKGKIDYLWNKAIWSEKIKAIEIDVDNLTGNTANFVSAGFESVNSQATLNGNAIRIQNTAGEFVEMNNTPELRSDDAGGTAVVLGKGRVQFYDSRGHAKGYVGTDMHTAGSYDFGTFLSKGTGIYRFARMADATETTYAYYTVKAGITTPSPIITDMVQNGYLPDGNAQQFVAKGNMLSELNGWPAYPNWPALSAGQQIRYKELTAQTTGDAYEDIWKFGPSSQGDWRIYFAKHARFEGGFTDVSDRRLKHDIEPTQVEALGHIESLAFKEFKWNRGNRYEPLGVIAQDSGIIRVSDDDVEGIDVQRAIMLGLKGVQELQEIVKQQAEEIKQLKEIVNQ